MTDPTHQEDAEIDKALGKFRKKPVVIEAFTVGSASHLWPDRANEMPAWLTKACQTNVITFVDDHCHVRTREGVMRGDLHDWIIHGVNGELYSCKPDIFTATYEPVIDKALGEDWPAKSPPLAPEIPIKRDQRPQRFAWAPGGYLAKCVHCGVTFVGDKRAHLCAPCAYNDAARISRAEAERLAEAWCKKNSVAFDASRMLLAFVRETWA